MTVQRARLLVNSRTRRPPPARPCFPDATPCLPDATPYRADETPYFADAIRRLPGETTCRARPRVCPADETARLADEILRRAHPCACRECLEEDGAPGQAARVKWLIRKVVDPRKWLKRERARFPG